MGSAERGYWLCDPATGGCGWTDDPSVLQPLTPQTATTLSPDPSTS